jgi:hypothetical protein
MNIVIALDPGFGNTKVCFDGQTSYCPSAVVHPRNIGLAGIGMKSHAKAHIVQVDGQEFAIGEGAWNHGQSANGMDYIGLASPARKALFFANLANYLDPGAYAFEQLVVGLPVPLLMDNTQAQVIFDRLKVLKDESVFVCDQGEYVFSFDKIKVLAQPVGAYADWLLDDDLQPRFNTRNLQVAVLDIGMNTLDLYVFKGGKVTPKYVGGGKVGVRRLLHMLDKSGGDLHELDDDLRNRRLRPAKGELDQWLDEIFHEVEKYWPNLKQFDSVVPVGGGSALLGERLHLEMIGKGAIVNWPEDPLLANVKGLWKWAAYELER